MNEYKNKIVSKAIDDYFWERGWLTYRHDVEQIWFKQANFYQRWEAVDYNLTFLLFLGNTRFWVPRSIELTPNFDEWLIGSKYYKEYVSKNVWIGEATLLYMI